MGGRGEKKGEGGDEVKSIQVEGEEEEERRERTDERGTAGKFHIRQLTQG